MLRKLSKPLTKKRVIGSAIVIGLTCASGRYYYRNYYPNRIVKENGDVKTYKNNVLIERKEYSVVYPNKLCAIKKYDACGRLTYEANYDRYSDQNELRDDTYYHNGSASMRTYYHDNKRTSDQKIYNGCGQLSEHTKYKYNGEIEKQISYINTHQSRAVVVKLLDEKGRDCKLDNGDIIVWKTATAEDKTPIKIKLLIPTTARRITTPSGYTRVESAKVLKITDRYGKTYDQIRNIDDNRYYYLGCIISSNFDESDSPKGLGITVSKYKE